MTPHFMKLSGHEIHELGAAAVERFERAKREDAPTACTDCGFPGVCGYRVVASARQWLCWPCMQNHVLYCSLRAR